MRGIDTFGHFEHEPRPDGDMQPDCVAPHQRITQRNAAILYRGTPVKGFGDTRR